VRGVQERRSVTSLTRAAPSFSAAPGRVGAHWVNLALGGGIAALVVAVDQVTKSWALDRLAHGSIHVLGPLDFELSFNTGASFSLFTGATVWLALIATVLVVALAVFVWRSPTRGRAAALGLVLGGALGNLADRALRGHHGAVVDFIALHVWPTFNVADSCIVVGGVLVVVSMWRARR
jgi:signal peptidase II